MFYPKRSRLLAFILLFSAVLVALILSTSGTDYRRPFRQAAHYVWPTQKPIVEQANIHDHSKAPIHFRDALDPNEKYITSFVSAGLTNQIIALFHLIQLAQLTNRTVILPPFAPIHVSLLAGFIPFSTVFDLSGFERAIGMRMLEWNDIKRTLPPPTSSNNTATDDKQVYHLLSQNLRKPPAYLANYFAGAPEALGCWSLTMSLSPRGDPPRHGEVMHALSLGISWTPIPFGHRAGARDQDVALEYLAGLVQGPTRVEAIATTKAEFLKGVQAYRDQRMSADERKRFPQWSDKVPTPVKMENGPGVGVEEGIEGTSFDPEEHVACFDYLFYTAYQNHESNDIHDEQIEQAMNSLGLKLKFSDHLRGISSEILSRALSPSNPRLTTPTEFPPYIAVHVRRGDFDSACRNKKMEPTLCFPSLSTYADAVEQVRQELSSSPSFRLADDKTPWDLPILIFSDEPKHTNPWYLTRFGRPAGTPEKFWEEVKQHGWGIIDHSPPDVPPQPGAATINKKRAGEGQFIVGGLDTENRYGVWYPTLVDSCVMAHAVGFVGTEPSTFSLFAAKRVVAWQGGSMRMVKSGIPT